MVVTLTGCGKKMTAQDGDVVKVHYTGTLDDGTQFDSSAGRDPLEFTIGAGQMIPGFEDAVRGMKVGDYKKVTIPADEAYGQPSEELYLEFPIEEMPEGLDPKVGDSLYMQQSNGQVTALTIIEVTDTTVTVDANHELAGKDLTFEIELIELERE